MKKVICLFMLMSCFAFSANADHITGGQIFYKLKSVNGANFTYAVTVKMYMDCKSFREFYNPAYVSVFNKKTGARLKDLMVTLTSIQIINLSEINECITNPPQVCHKIGYYIFDLILPADPDGYLLTTEVFFRVNNMNNLTPYYNNIGATYTAEIPGTFLLTSGPHNNSAEFTGSDLVIICSGHSFEYSFGATDPDGDELVYSLCNAYRSDNFMFGIDLTPAAAPPYESVPYNPEYSGARPLGSLVQINQKTGLISGIAPEAGTYVVTVCVDEKRDSKIIATQRKDLQINVANCSFTAATLADNYLLCDTSTSVYIENLSASPTIESYNWQITNNNGTAVFNSTEPTLNYTFTDTGLYNVQLYINKNEKCSDSTQSKIIVYPGFKPDFMYNGVCIDKSTQFTDLSTSFYGNVSAWKWNFTNEIYGAVTSVEQNPTYHYSTTGNKVVSLIAGDTKGCLDTVFKNIEIVDIPPINLSFTDTLICKPDTLQLIANGAGSYKWSPANELINATSANPTIIPTKTTTYYVDLDVDGCINHDSVTVNVVDHVSLKTMKDTTICSGDQVQLVTVSDGLKYSWTPSDQLNNASVQQPIATVFNNTNFTVTANIGHCTATGNVLIKTVPYPVALAGNDTIICYGTSAFLNGYSDAANYQWSPQVYITNTNALNTIAHPINTTTYILTAYDTKGCPKPGIDSVTVTVLPKINAFAGNDTSVVINQPLQLNGMGGSRYNWYPPDNLSNASIPNPVATFYNASPGNVYKLYVGNEAGCIDSASLTIKVYKTIPAVFVPTGFTPNRDGKNDVLRPILAGMQRIEVFNVYNRWGQLLFSTSTEGKGWDGTTGGTQQPSGTYVWMIKAIDYDGKPYFNKGTTTLIR